MKRRKKPARKAVLKVDAKKPGWVEIDYLLCLVRLAAAAERIADALEKGEPDAKDDQKRES